MTALELFGQTSCDLCGEPLEVTDEVAEMYHPDDPLEETVVVHGQCGLDRGMDLA